MASPKLTVRLSTKNCILVRGNGLSNRYFLVKVLVLVILMLRGVYCAIPFMFLDNVISFFTIDSEGNGEMVLLVHFWLYLSKKKKKLLALKGKLISANIN